MLNGSAAGEEGRAELQAQREEVGQQAAEPTDEHLLGPTADPSPRAGELARSCLHLVGAERVCCIVGRVDVNDHRATSIATGGERDDGDDRDEGKGSDGRFADGEIEGDAVGSDGVPMCGTSSVSVRGPMVARNGLPLTPRDGESHEPS